MNQLFRSRKRVAGTLGAAALVAIALAGRTLLASDHQDTPEVELAPRYDVNDVYAFPGSTPDRIVLVLGTASPVTPAQTPSFTFGNAEDELYQLKIDNNGDAREDLVLQFSFGGPAGNQRVFMRGPFKPNQVGTANTLLPTISISGATNTRLSGPNESWLFAGPRDDPFFIDLEQFFRIIPDRRPSTGPLSAMPRPASRFRGANDAVDFLRGINDMAIVVELPTRLLYADGKTPSKLGIWGTTSKPRPGQ